MPQNTSNPLIFISYARKDGRDAAKHLDETLPAHGFRTWRDERGIDATKDFTVEIENAIRASDYVVACITPDIINRDDSFVRRELNYALFHKKAVIVARFADVPPPIQVFNHTWVDYFGRDEAQADRDLHAKLTMPRDQLGNTVAQTDPFRAYVGWLYDRMVRLLNQAVIRLIDLDIEDSPDRVVPPHHVTTRDIFDQRYLPYEPTPQSNPDYEMPCFDTFTAAYEHYNGRLLLLGEPGAGKSVSLMALARDAAAARLENPVAPLPVFGIVATWNAEARTPLVEWLAASHKDLSQRELATTIKEGKALLLLDGLDELVDSDKYHDPRKMFLSLIPENNQVVLSCRTEEYTEIGELADLHGAITLKPLSDNQISNYLKNDSTLLSAVLANDDLRAMVRIPLIMSLFAFAYRDDANITELRPSDENSHFLRVMIFDRYVRERYRWEYQKREPLKDIPFERIQAAFAKLAFEIFDKNLPTVNSAKQVLKLFSSSNTFWRKKKDALALLQTGQDLGFIELQGGEVRFYHQLLLEYFAAVHFDIHFGQIRINKKLGGPITAGISTDPFTRRRVIWGEVRIKGYWDQVMIALSGISSNPDAVIQEITEIDCCLAAYCIQSGVKVSKETQIVLLQQLIAGLHLSFCITASELIGNLWIPEILPDLIDMLKHEDENTRRYAAITVARIGRPAVAAMPRLKELLRSDNYMAMEAAFALGKVAGPDEISDLRSLISSEDKYSDRAIYAAEALAIAGDQWAFELLGERLFTYELVGTFAAEALGRIGSTTAVNVLSHALSKNGPYLSYYVKALNQIGSPSSDQALSDFYNTICSKLRSDDEQERIGGAENSLSLALSLRENLQSTSVIPYLISALYDQNVIIRSYAARAFKDIKEPAAVPALIERLNDNEFYESRGGINENLTISSVAADALEEIGTPEALRAVKEWRRNQNT